MAKSTGFQGFSRKAPAFFKDLAENNDKIWFDEHREDYEQFVLNPAKEFVSALGEELRVFVPGIKADPRVNKSLFRINRDTRFSKDKTPYKTHMGLWFWEGEGPRMECSGFYFHLELGNIMLGAGFYIFPKNVLEAYRQSVVHEKHGPALAKAIKKVTGEGFDLGGRHYKRTPSGYDPGHKNAEYLLHNGLYVGAGQGMPEELFGPECVTYCAEQYQKMLPLHQWLVALTERLPG